MIAQLKQSWWWISDPAWRRQFTANRRRIRTFRQLQRRAVQQLLRANEAKILAGPFAGMSFSPAREPHSYCAQVLLGTYELELREAIETISRTDYSRIFEVGADIGYYVCGFKHRLPQVNVTAFEMSEHKHPAIADLVRDNGVEQGVEIHGFCDAAALEAQLTGEPRPLVFCDIDGGEVALLDPQQVPALAKTDILVETHDGLRPGITELLQQRFAPTHRVELIRERPRTVADAPPNTGLTDEELLGAMDEFRGFPQDWLWMTARQGGDGGAA